jgi:hypothetical protein
MKNLGILKTFIALTLSVAAVTAARASLIVNGDFESGNSGFTSAYEYTTASGGLATGGEGSGGGKYAIGTNPQYYHSGFASFGDHTSGTGNMMIVNGSFTPGKNVWTGSLVSSLVVGQTYVLSAWVRNAYAASPASLRFSVGGVQVGSDFSVIGTDQWHQFTATFVAAANQTPTAVDINTAFSGNDFAIDDLSLVAVPEPSTYLAGALLLLPFGVQVLRRLRPTKPSA